MTPNLPRPEPAVRPSVCFIGLGIQGFPIAERLLLQGFPLSAWNRSADKSAPLAPLGARLPPTVREAAEGAAIVMLCLTDERAVEAVLFGTEGIAEVLTANTILLDCSTISIAATRSFAGRLRARSGAAWIDAPVSGGPSGARAGTLAIFCGGEASDIARVRPVLEAISGVATHMGRLGAGQATKVCSQMIVSTTILAIAEAITAGRALGLDVDKFAGAVAGGYADSRPLQLFAPRMASGQLTPRISEVATMLKDAQLIAAATADLPVDLRLARTVLSLYEAAAASGLKGEDLGALPALSSRVRTS